LAKVLIILIEFFCGNPPIFQTMNLKKKISFYIQVSMLFLLCPAFIPVYILGDLLIFIYKLWMQLFFVTHLVPQLSTFLP